MARSRTHSTVLPYPTAPHPSLHPFTESVRCAPNPNPRRPNADADIWNFSAPHIKKTPGCTAEERASFGQMLGPEFGMVDTYRRQNPDVQGAFTYWGMRNVIAR